jgi:conjugative relaxase-like TrwC/TraI family protein
VLSVAKLAAGQEAYYEHQVASGLEDYLAGRGESPGLWVGSGAEDLGLAGVVDDGALGVLLGGVSPVDGARLRAPAPSRTITVRELDPVSGVWRDEPKTLTPVAGFDLVFSCPKTVSLLHALTDDEGARRAISEAHEASWRAALGYLEREACVVRRGRGGAVREHGGGFVAAAFRHRTSRAQDPHLHTHVIVANLAKGGDGKWRALDGEAILRTYRLAAGYLYEANLRGELSRTLGVRWREPVKGMAEIEGVPEEAIRTFSTRRQSLVEHMQAMGTFGFAAARVAALATRERKERVDLPELRQAWISRAAEVGLGAAELRGLRGCEPAGVEPPVLDTVAVGASALTAHRTTFTTPEVVCAVAGAARDGISVHSVRAAVERIVETPGVLPVGDGAAPGRPARFTAQELVELEREALELAMAGRGAGAPSASRVVTVAAMAQAPVRLSAEQRALVETAALSPDRVVCVVGAAGAGKTTALRALGVALSRSGLPVLGAAPSGRAAEELQGATDVPATTLHGLLAEARASGGLPPGCVLVIDEAGMADTRVLAPALRMVEEAGGKAILVGDPAQLPAVGAGGLYAALCVRLGAAQLVENRRQRDAAERHALERLRAGEGEPYLAHAASQGRLRLIEDAHEAKERLLAEWWQAAAADLGGSVMLAYRRADVRELNAAARALLRDGGRLGEEALLAGGREFRPGDRVVCRRNDGPLGLRNATRGTVTLVDPIEGSLTLMTDVGDTRRIPAGYAREHLEHGYALTGHAAQGATVNRAFVLLRGEGALSEWAYVACSRARMETRVYGVALELEGAELLGTPARESTSRSLAAALRRSMTEALATEHLGGDAAVAAPPPGPKRPGFRDRIRGRTLRNELGVEPPARSVLG